MTDNKLVMVFSSKSQNEGFARSAVAAFICALNPTIEQLSDIKTAVSEAVTNAIVHGYDGQEGEITVEVEIEGRKVHITVRDEGVGIADVTEARKPFFTTKQGEERSGMGFTVMECVMDSVEVESRGKGVTVKMTKEIE